MAAKKNKLSDIQGEINKLVGDNSLVNMSDMDIDVPRVKTNIFSLDKALNGGLPKGQIAIAYGKEGGGKSAIAMQLVGEAQKHGSCVYIDLENSFDPSKAINSGIDMDSLFFSQPQSAEDTLKIISMSLEADDVSCIVVDSVAAMTTRAQIEGDFGDAHVATLARILSDGLSKIVSQMRSNDSDTILFFVNQIRDLIGGYGPVTTTTPGGRALRFYASTMLEVARVSNIKSGNDVIGQTSQCIFRKSRFAPPLQKIQFDILYDKGISNESSILDLAIANGLVEKKSGGHMTDLTTGEKLGQGKPAVVDRMLDEPSITENLLTQLEQFDN